jgi:ABC-type multidrug transport system ATPase subunit
MTDDLLRVEQLSKRYGQAEVLSDVSFSVRPGEILGLIGPNGAGKTTLIESVVGLLDTDGGQVSYHGWRLAAGAGPAQDGDVLPAGQHRPPTAT